ncbi:glycosyltransferase family 2 protein [Altererythrobacter sp. Z27]|uniref:glycosyltransferase family 2 protein n=1 Tax=Altererythrobacter sp. Z27 TaxID=3461147 RepID=UPI00404394C7
MTPRLSILIVGFNSSRFLPDCIGSLDLASRRHSFELLFIDNGGDGSAEMITRLQPAAIVLPGRGNIGFAAANNLLARQASGEWLLLLNPDTELYPGAIDLMLDAAASAENYGILGGTTVIDKQSQALLPELELPDHRTILRGLVGRAPRKSALPGTDPVASVSATSGGFMLIRRSVWKELSGLDDRFFLYGEDMDFCHRAQDAGWKVGRVAAARIFHDIGSGEFVSPQRLKYRETGTATYHHKHFSGPRAWAHVALMWLSIFVRTILAGAAQFVGTGQRARFRSLAPLAFKPWSWMRGYRRHGDNNAP